MIVTSLSRTRMTDAGRECRGCDSMLTRRPARGRRVTALPPL